MPERESCHQEPRQTAPSVARLLSTLEAENWGRMGGRDRFAVINFPGSVAVVPQSLAVSVWCGLQDAREGL